MTQTLASNNVTCRNFKNAAYYYIHLSEQYGLFNENETPSQAQLAQRIRLSDEAIRRANLYYAYDLIYIHATQPLPYNELTLFRASRYMLSMISGLQTPLNIGKHQILYALARMANRLDMIRTARSAYEKLQSVIIPLTIMQQIDIQSLLIRGKSLTDRDELLDVCYRCKQTVPQFTSAGDKCPNCYHPFIRSFINFQALPLVQFTLANSLNDADVEQYLINGMLKQTSAGSKGQQQSQNDKVNNTNDLDEYNKSEKQGNDLQQGNSSGNNTDNNNTTNKNGQGDKTQQ